jgi:putative spermidine/putrescine transport system permease protein
MMAAERPRAAPLARETPAARSYSLMLPAAFLVLVVFFGSMAGLFAYSLQQFRRGRLLPGFSIDAYARFFGDAYYLGILLTTLRLAATATVIGLLVAYPVAYALNRLRQPRALIPAYVVLFSPMLVSAVVISYGWLLLLSERGLLSVALQALRLADRPVRTIFTFHGVVIAMVHALMPFIVFPILSTMRHVRADLKEAAQDLGASRWRTFRYITLPLTMPGVIGAAQVAFTLSVSAFAVPALIGGGRVRVLSRQIYSDLTGLDFPLAAVGSIVMLLVSLAAILVSNLLTRRYFEYGAQTR